jgi:mitochondrial import receptor subunit TOM40
MDIRKLLVKVFAASPVHCSKKEEVELDDPAFSQIDPHLKVDENEDSLEENDEMTPPGAPRKVSRKPPPFHAIFNNIKAITAKVEHIKGFKFEISTPISQRFFINHSWIIPNSSAEGAAAPP